MLFRSPRPAGSPATPPDPAGSVGVSHRISCTGLERANNAHAATGLFPPGLGLSRQIRVPVRVKPLPLPMERHDPCRSGVPKPPRRPVMPDGGGILELAHRCEGQSAISRPHPRLRQSHGSKGDLPRVFTADTLIAQAIKIKAKPDQTHPCLSQDVRSSPRGVDPCHHRSDPARSGRLLSWSCGSYVRRKRRAERRGHPGMACGPRRSFRSHPVPRSRPQGSLAIAGSATKRRVAGLCLQPPIRFP